MTLGGPTPICKVNKLNVLHTHADRRRVVSIFSTLWEWGQVPGPRGPPSERTNSAEWSKGVVAAFAVKDRWGLKPIWRPDGPTPWANVKKDIPRLWSAMCLC